MGLDDLQRMLEHYAKERPGPKTKAGQAIRQKNRKRLAIEGVDPEKAPLLDKIQIVIADGRILSPGPEFSGDNAKLRWPVSTTAGRASLKRTKSWPFSMSPNAALRPTASISSILVCQRSPIEFGALNPSSRHEAVQQGA